MTKPIPILELSHAEMVETIRATDAPVFVAVNPVEFHGPHLSLHNDKLVTEGLSRDLHAALADGRADFPFLVAHELELGVEPCSGPGTRHVPYAHVRAVLLETVRALAEIGVKRIVINTFHGGGLHNLAIEEACAAFTKGGGRAFAPLAIALRSMVDLDPTLLEDALQVVPEAERRAVAEDLRFDFHAGWLETSLALHYAPTSVSPRFTSLRPAPSLAPDPLLRGATTIARLVGARGLATELDFLATAVTWPRLRPFIGYTGRPHLASAEAGARIAATFIARYAEAARAVLYGAADQPRAPFRFLPALTLGGRLAPTFVPLSDIDAESS
ncbi:MAG: creatininase family protein [Myxococcales bacterium]|nr:creatininase family protein [Myxococcales bacterium]